MADAMSPQTRRTLPLILIRGFGGLDTEDERKQTYQGFNQGTVYPTKRGENYIYEGLVLRFLKSRWQYRDATNVVGYYPSIIWDKPATLPAELEPLAKFFFNDQVVADPQMTAHLLNASKDAEALCRTLWVLRYYDLDNRNFEAYGKSLVRLIDFIQALVGLRMKSPPKVNIIAHSMGGLIVRQAIQCSFPESGRKADDHINKVVTLGTPHQGISFQILKHWLPVGAEQELEAFNPGRQSDPNNPAAFVNFHNHFPLDRLLTVVGTNYRTYSLRSSSLLNRLFSVSGEGALTYNRSDGLVQQTYAQMPGAPRTFVHKCHGGEDSLTTSREAFEAATRFFFGDIRVRLRLVTAKISRGADWFGKSEFFFGIQIKPRGVDFDLFHQSAEAENCYGPFADTDLGDAKVAFPWVGEDYRQRVIWEGFVDTGAILPAKDGRRDIVLRLDVYVGERDTWGIGFSDNVIFRKQYYVRALLEDPCRLFLYTDESFAGADDELPEKAEMRFKDGEWQFRVKGTGFRATFGIAMDLIPEEGAPAPFENTGT